MRWPYLLIASSVLVLDQVAKAFVVAHITPERIVPVIPRFFRLVLVENRGIAFGMLADADSRLRLGITVALSTAALGLVCWLLFKDGLFPALGGYGLALILGGASGNLLDRLFRGGVVVDFLDFYVGRHHWPAFNVADTAIVVGMGMLAWDLLVSHHDARQ